MTVDRSRADRLRAPTGRTGDAACWRCAVCVPATALPTVLHGIDLTVGPGEVVVVLGANGAGKTTLMRAITGLIPHTGTIAVDGTAGRPEPVRTDAAARRSGWCRRAAAR